LDIIIYHEKIYFKQYQHFGLIHAQKVKLVIIIIIIVGRRRRHE